MPREPHHHIAIIGAGIAGLACARRLATAGHSPVVYDKSRGIGGRIATRRTTDDLAFDHGAQFVTAHGDAFAEVLHTAETRGMAAQWSAFAKGGHDNPIRYVGVPGMSSLVKPLAEGLTINTSHTLTSLSSAENGWHLTFAEESTAAITADLVALCVPAPQVSPFLAPFPESKKEIDTVEIAPCWTLMVTFESAPMGLPIAQQVADDGPIAWVATNTSKPGRASSPVNIVVHAGPDWSRTHLERGQDDICIRLLQALEAYIGDPLPPILHARSHRWRYAKTTKPLGRPYIEIAPGRLFAAGDWCLGARVEAGYDSGRALADQILKSLSAPHQLVGAAAL